MENKKDYDTFVKLFEEATKLNAVDLFNKAFKLGFSLGYDSAVKTFEDKY